MNPLECLRISAGDYIHLCISAYVRMYVHTYNRTVIFIVLAMMYFYYTNVVGKIVHVQR